MGLFARKNSGVDNEAVQTSDILDGSQQPAIVESQRSRMTLRKRPKDNTQAPVQDGLEPEQDNGSTNKAKKQGMFTRKSKPLQDEYTMEPAPQPSNGLPGEKKSWMGRKPRVDRPIAPPPQPGDRVPKEKKKKVVPKKKKKTGPKRNWIGRKSKDQPEPEEDEDDTSVSAIEVVQEPPKPPPRIRTPEEVAAGLERQKAAVNAIRNTPEKRAATRALAPIEIPSTSNATSYSTAPVDRSSANRAPNDRSGGKFKGMFKVRGMPSMPSVPGLKKRNSVPAGESTVVSSAPVEVDPSLDPTSPADNADGKVAPAVAADMKKGGKFKGMFMRGSKAKKSVVVGGKGKGKSKGKGSSVPDEVELSDQVDQLDLKDEPVLGRGAAAEHVQPASYAQPAQHVPSQHAQQATGMSGITTQEYAPVLPQTVNSMHNNSQQETNSYCTNHHAANAPPPEYPEGASTYRMGGMEQPNGHSPAHHNVREAKHGSGYPGGASSYKRGGGQQSNGYYQRTGGYGGGQGGYSSEEEDGQLASGDWEHVNKTWNRQ